MVTQDVILTCKDCAGSFVFSAGEQQFFAERGLTNEPKRCQDCRLIARARRNGQTDHVTKSTCEDCGVAILVNFVPTGTKPIYCQTCIASRKQAVKRFGT